MRLPFALVLVAGCGWLLLNAPSATGQASAAAASGASPAPAVAAAKAPAGPTDAKAKQTYAEAVTLKRQRKYGFALDGFRKADKQDGGHCIPCELAAYDVAREISDYKAQREQAQALLESVTTAGDKAQAHYLMGSACFAEGLNNKHDKSFQAADDEFKAALEIKPGKSECVYADGVTLAHLKEDGAARERFQQYLKMANPDGLDYPRAQRFAENPELARARVAPNFRLTTLDGQEVTLDSLMGKVVLIDFWATWCGPCREALPHVRQIAKKFAGQPFVVVSISLDREDGKWKDFVAKNDMTWLQYRDGYFAGPIATLFDVKAIPATFTIDADGVLQDQHVGDADIEGKLKKLISRAVEMQNRKPAAVAAANGGTGQ